MLAGINGIVGFVSSISGGGGTGGSFAVSVDSTDVSRSGATRGAGRTLTSPPVTVTASGGAGGYSHSWSRISGSASISADAASAATTTFSGTLSAGDEFSAEFIDTVRDATGARLNSDIVTVTLSLDDVEIGGHL